VKLLARIEKLIGRKVPLATLFRGQTVAEMAKYLEETPKFGGEPLVTELQRGTSRRPFFVIAAPGVRTLGYALLARHLGIEQPFYKIQAQSPVARDRLLTEDELCALASQYIQGIRTIQPEGPYSFGAMCAGCRIVEQMILQLEAAGEEVMFFAVFDTWVIENVNRPWLWKAYYYQQRLRSFWKSKGPDKLHMVRNAVENRIRKSPVLPVTNQSHTDWKQALWPKDYTPTRFQTPITLFRRRKQPFYYIDDPKMGWESRTHSGVEVHEIELEGLQHLEILRDPSVRVLAERLSDCLRRVAPSAAHRNAAGFSPFNAHGAATGKGS